MATIGNNISVTLGESTFAQSFDWSEFFKTASTKDRFAAAAAPSAPDAPKVDDPIDTTPHCGGALVIPPDPFMLYGTDGEPDRFEFKAGYDQGYTIVGFEPGRDVIVVDGKTAGVDQFALEDIRAVTPDAIDGFFYDRSMGVLTISTVLGVTFATVTGQSDTPDLAPADFEIV